MPSRWFDDHPWLGVIVALLCSLVSAYWAVYLRHGSLMAVVDWVFAVLGFLAFLGLLLNALSD